MDFLSNTSGSFIPLFIFLEPCTIGLATATIQIIEAVSLCGSVKESNVDCILSNTSGITKLGLIVAKYWKAWQASFMQNLLNIAVMATGNILLTKASTSESVNLYLSGIGVSHVGVAYLSLKPHNTRFTFRNI